MPAGHFSVINCLVLEYKQHLRFVPQHVHYYFINSRRRFLIYFKYRHQMLETMRIFQEQKIRFYQRESLLPDREELEEQGFHCNYKHKRIDLRKSLTRDTPYHEPRLYFDRFERSQSHVESQKELKVEVVRQPSPVKPSLPKLPSQAEISAPP